MLLEHCYTCHAATATERYGAPEAIDFDTYAEVVANRDRMLSVLDTQPPRMPRRGGALSLARPLVLSASPGIPALGPSGASAHLRGIATALSAPIVCPRAADGRGVAGHLGTPVYVAGMAGWPTWAPRQGLREVRTARRCADLAIDYAPTLVWERHGLYSDAGWRVHTATGARWILEVNAPLVEERRRFESLADEGYALAWERDVLLAAPEIVCVSAWLVDWLRDIGCRVVRHLPNGVAAHRGDREAARARLGLGSAFTLGFVGSLKPWHGADRLPAILDALPEAVALVAGTGPVRVEHPRLRHLGHLDEPALADAIASMDVAFAPYRADAPPWFSPLKILAYRAQGTPVVATDLGDCRLLVGEGGTVLPAQGTDMDLAEAAVGWRGRRTIPWVRSWEDVVAEGLA